MTMGDLREVERDTPILDAIEGRSMLVGGLLREGWRWFRRIRQRRQQKHIDKTWHNEANGSGVGEGDE